MSRAAATRKPADPVTSTRGPAPAPPAPAALIHAVMYCRVSSKDQEKEGFSIPAQQKLLREYAEQRGFRVVEEFVDVETAKRAGRTSFTRMADWLRQNARTCRTVLVEKTDRLYRNVKDWVELDGMNLEIHLIKENVVLSDDSRSHEKFIHGIKVLMAKNFIDNLSEEAKKGLAEKARQGIWPSRAPLGYLNHVRPDGKHVIVPDPELAPVIKRIFELYETGNYSLVTITKAAKKEGLHFRKSKQALPRTSIHTILQNRLYTGDFEWHGVRYVGIHQPLIAHDTYERVQAILEGRAMSSRHDGAREFLFSGLIRCGVCAAEEDPHLLVGEIKKQKYIYYRCENCKRLGRAVYVPEARLDEAVLRALRTLDMGEHNLTFLREALRDGHDAIAKARDQAVERINAQLARLQKRIDVAYDDRLDGRIDADLFESRSRAWREEQMNLRQELSRYDAADQGLIEAAPALLEIARTSFQLYERMNEDEKRFLLKFLSSNFIWTPTTLTPVWREPFDLLPNLGPKRGTGPDATSAPEPVFEGWQGHKDSNLGPADLESAALPTELYPFGSTLLSGLRAGARSAGGGHREAHRHHPPAVPGELREVPRADHLHQEDEGEPADHQRGAQPGEPARQHRRVDGHVVGLQQHGPGDGRHRHHEGEPAREVAPEPERHGDGDGGARARDGGEDREALGDADEHRMPPPQVGEGLRPLPPPGGEVEGDGGDRELPGQRRRRGEVALEVVLQREAHQRGGDGGDADEQEPAHPLALQPRPLPAERRQHHAEEVLPEQDQHRDQGADVEHEVEGERVPLDGQEVLEQHQVPGGGDGQELGEALQRAEEQRHEEEGHRGLAGGEGAEVGDEVVDVGLGELGEAGHRGAGPAGPDRPRHLRVGAPGPEGRGGEVGGLGVERDGRRPLAVSVHPVAGGAIGGVQRLPGPRLSGGGEREREHERDHRHLRSLHSPPRGYCPPPASASPAASSSSGSAGAAAAPFPAARSSRYCRTRRLSARSMVSE